MLFNQDNFYDATEANFTSCEIPTSEPDYESYGGSKYWYTPNGVIRVSNHWGDAINSCNWYLDGGYYGYGFHPLKRLPNGKPDPKARVFADGVTWEQETYEMNNPVAGFCAWANFKENVKYRERYGYYDD